MSTNRGILLFLHSHVTGCRLQNKMIKMYFFKHLKKCFTNIFLVWLPWIFQLHVFLLTFQKVNNIFISRYYSNEMVTKMKLYQFVLDEFLVTI